MASFDITSELDWHELDNAVNQARKEISNRFDFRGVESKIDIDQKQKLIEIWCSEPTKLDSVDDVFQNKLVKRGISLLSLNYQDVEDAFGGSSKKKILLNAGISKDKGKEIVKLIKAEKMKVQAQIQDEQVRVTAKKRDDLQEVISFLKSKQSDLKIPLQFGNYRD